MKGIVGRHCIAVAASVALLAGCGGGGGSSGSSSQTALSADQAVFESFTLAPNASYGIGWYLPLSGAPVSGVNYLSQSSVSLAASPLTAGPQNLVSSAAVSLAKTLTLPTTAPGRFVINGAIVVGSSTQAKVSYQGTAVRVDELATDGVTVVDSTLRSGFSTVQLSGTVAAAPAEFAQTLGALYFNSALLNTSTTWNAGAAYEKHISTEVADLYTVGDYSTVTTGNTPTPVATGTTIAALIAAGGIAITADNTTWTLANGSVSTVNGVTTYVSATTLPNVTTPMYRTFYELNGNVYVGVLVKAGTQLGGNAYPVASAGGGYTMNYSQNYQIRLNAAAVASLGAAVTF